MSRDNRINMPSGMGGLVRYFEDYKSRFQIKPGAVIILSIVIIVAIMALHKLGASWFSP